MRTDPEFLPTDQVPGRRTLARVCWLVFALVLAAFCVSPVAAQFEDIVFPDEIPRPSVVSAPTQDRLLTPADAPLVVSRKYAALQLTNAYNASGIRYLVIKLGFRNTQTSDVTVNTKASKLLVGNEEILRVQGKSELQSNQIMLPDRAAPQVHDIDELQGPSPLTVRANVKSAEAWLLFANLPRTRDLPPLKLRLDTSAGPIEIDLTRIENEAITSTLERIGPSGRIGIARIAGELNALNAPHFAKLMTQYGEQGVSRLVIAFEKNSRVGDELTSEWLSEGRDADNDRLQFYPQWSGLVRGVVLVNMPE